MTINIIDDDVLEGNHDVILSIMETSPLVTIKPDCDSVVITMSDSIDRK